MGAGLPDRDRWQLARRHHQQTQAAKTARLSAQALDLYVAHEESRCAVNRRAGPFPWAFCEATRYIALQQPSRCHRCRSRDRSAMAEAMRPDQETRLVLTQETGSAGARLIRPLPLSWPLVEGQRDSQPCSAQKARGVKFRNDPFRRATSTRPNRRAATRSPRMSFRRPPRSAPAAEGAGVPGEQDARAPDQEQQHDREIKPVPQHAIGKGGAIGAGEVEDRP